MYTNSLPTLAGIKLTPDRSTRSLDDIGWRDSQWGSCHDGHRLVNSLVTESRALGQFDISSSAPPPIGGPAPDLTTIKPYPSASYGGQLSVVSGRPPNLKKHVNYAAIMISEQESRARRRRSPASRPALARELDRIQWRSIQSLWQQCPAPPMMRSLLRSSNLIFSRLCHKSFCISPNQYVGYPRCSFVDESFLVPNGVITSHAPSF
ncbi:hypothetical protein PAXRUDRAFT_440201 [Paxillus rubicundulus Ve08.2h10]|uniref:Uncharacterized protein n=1 Tax=Paxillus rubicundulus Ve08.2h10 TaxID=930991 RepID=A0A0D0DQE2_9AGAM|nr:hypothetical protein PAXRUDRAFT_440201 [Paxillus rubicundulus Ve08.2h10]